ncbi:MAG: hypothetical protein WCL18_00960 [bacterium]
MKSKKNSQGKKEIKKVKKIVVKKAKPVAKKTKPIVKKVGKPATPEGTAKQSNISLSKTIKVAHKPAKTNEIPALFKDFYRE